MPVVDVGVRALDDPVGVEEQRLAGREHALAHGELGVVDDTERGPPGVVDRPLLGVGVASAGPAGGRRCGSRSARCRGRRRTWTAVAMLSSDGCRSRKVLAAAISWSSRHATIRPRSAPANCTASRYGGRPLAAHVDEHHRQAVAAVRRLDQVGDEEVAAVLEARARRASPTCRANRRARAGPDTAPGAGRATRSGRPRPPVHPRRHSEDGCLLCTWRGTMARVPLPTPTLHTANLASPAGVSLRMEYRARPLVAGVVQVLQDCVEIVGGRPQLYAVALLIAARRDDCSAPQQPLKQVEAADADSSAAQQKSQCLVEESAVGASRRGIPR